MTTAQQEPSLRASLHDPDLLCDLAYIGGKWITVPTSEYIEVQNPATGELLAVVPRLGAAHANQAIESAAAAFEQWSLTTAEERAGLLHRWCDVILQCRGDLAAILTAEQGKPLAEAFAEIDYAASYVKWFAEEARRAYGEIIPSPWRGREILVTREPVGVCAAITPWNFPAAMITRKVAPALAAGCTMIVKPALQTPLTALALAKTAQRAGIPAGVVTVITGDARNIAAVLTANPQIRKLSFTGSTPVGRLLAQASAGTLKKLSLELGGNAPFIVFDDADIDAAVEGAMAAKFRNSGQTCVCANRLLVQSSIYDEFARKLTAAVDALRVGDGSRPGVQQGPLIDLAAVEKVETLVRDAVSKGAKVAIGGRRHTLGGNFWEPTVLLDVQEHMQISSEEVFGPVAPLIRFDTEDEAVRIANATEYGLAGYFYSRDIGRTWRVGRRLACGMVGINTGIISTAVAPFGGVNQSGWGREGSSHGLHEYQELKYLCMGGTES
jgi:succinate-semialdehyde dehydrogenase / glutarate-semialdehyde dehydrogenase